VKNVASLVTRNHLLH